MVIHLSIYLSWIKIRNMEEKQMQNYLGKEISSAQESQLFCLWEFGKLHWQVWKWDLPQSLHSLPLALENHLALAHTGRAALEATACWFCWPMQEGIVNAKESLSSSHSTNNAPTHLSPQQSVSPAPKYESSAEIAAWNSSGIGFLATPGSFLRGSEPAPVQQGLQDKLAHSTLSSAITASRAISEGGCRVGW